MTSSPMADGAQYVARQKCLMPPKCMPRKGVGDGRRQCQQSAKYLPYQRTDTYSRLLPPLAAHAPTDNAEKALFLRRE